MISPAQMCVRSWPLPILHWCCANEITRARRTLLQQHAVPIAEVGGSRIGRFEKTHQYRVRICGASNSLIGQYEFAQIGVVCGFGRSDARVPKAGGLRHSVTVE